MTRNLSKLLVACLALATLTLPAHDASARKLKKWSKPNIAQMQKACDKGDLKTCVRLGWYTMDGWWGTTQDLAKTGEMMKKACDGGELSGCSGLARQITYNSNEIKPDQTELFKKGCDGDDALGCYWLGRWDKLEDRGPHMAKAYKLYIKACDGGDVESCYAAAIMNRDSHQDFYEASVPWDDEAASKLWTDACGADYPEGCTRLGGANEEGRGVKEDWHKAKSLYDKACKLGDTDACQYSKDLVAKALLAGRRL